MSLQRNIAAEYDFFNGLLGPNPSKVRIPFSLFYGRESVSISKKKRKDAKTRKGRPHRVPVPQGIDKRLML